MTIINAGSLKRMIAGLPADAPIALFLDSCASSTASYDDLNVVIETICPNKDNTALHIHVSIVTDTELKEDLEENISSLLSVEDSEGQCLNCGWRWIQEACLLNNHGCEDNKLFGRPVTIKTKSRCPVCGWCALCDEVRE